jgi:mono/diheme cytochrome c family protein
VPFRSPRIIVSLATIAVGLLPSGASLATPSQSIDGHHVFMQSGCFGCHGQLGYGGAGPGFRGDKMLAAQDFVIARILLGGGIMPVFGNELSDKEIAAVASYIRTSWGNAFGPVDPEQVAKIRAALDKGKAKPASGAQGATP